MTDRVLTIGGPPGSGKSTAGRAVAVELGREFVSAGELFRAEARRRGVTLLELSKLAEADPSIDRTLDDEMIRRANPSRLLDGRVTGPLLRRRGIPTQYVIVTAREQVRYDRLAGRDGGVVDDVARQTAQREASEHDRYHRYYGIDLAAEHPDLLIDSSELSPGEVVRRIVAFAAPPGRA
ncbi:MAG: AAA family ATPase [Thermoplasmata archaeon]|nr:AAA family ATPase [Thermoplasmata archaeon]